jgi:hypothetical protein
MSCTIKMPISGPLHCSYLCQTPTCEVTAWLQPPPQSYLPYLSYLHPMKSTFIHATFTWPFFLNRHCYNQLYDNLFFILNWHLKIVNIYDTKWCLRKCTYCVMSISMSSNIYHCFRWKHSKFSFMPHFWEFYNPIILLNHKRSVRTFISSRLYSLATHC